MNFSPVIYEHAARFTGQSPWKVSRDAELLAGAHIAAWKEYRHSPVTVGIDIYNLEAEAYGAVVQPQEDFEVPSLAGPICDDPAELKNLGPMDIRTDGRWPLVMKAAEIIRKELPDVDLRIPLGGPFSIAANLAGFESLLIYAFTEEEGMAAILKNLAENQADLAGQIIRAGYGVSFFESAATPPMLSPDMFRRIEIPPLRLILEELERLSGTKAALILGGDTSGLSGDLAQAGAGFLICPSETDQGRFLDNLAGKNVLVRINMDAGIIASGNWEAIREEAERVKVLMEKYPGTFAGSGVLPYTADPSLIHRISDFFR